MNHVFLRRYGMRQRDISRVISLYEEERERKAYQFSMSDWVTHTHNSKDTLLQQNKHYHKTQSFSNKTHR